MAVNVSPLMCPNTRFSTLWTRVHQPSGPPRDSRTSPATAIRWFAVVACGLLSAGTHHALSAATVPPGFTETVVAGPSGGNWTEAVGLTFDSTGRIVVWERPGRVWFKDPGDATFSPLLDIREEVGDWQDHGFLGFALDPNFRVNGYIYLLYVVDRHYLLNFGT